MKSILLIEDNKELRENTAEILELAGYKVNTAADGKKGVEDVQKSKPDLIVCDIMMPVLDGYGVLHLLNKHPETSNIPFIFLSAKAERSDLRKGMEMGADDYITKPFDKIELLNAVESRLKKAESIKKEYDADIEGLTTFIGDAFGNNATLKFIEGKTIRRYNKKENIYREGDYPRGMYYINKGKIKIYKVHEYGKELITDLLSEGDFFGYTSLLEGKEYIDNAEALEDAELILIPNDEFFNLIYNYRDIAKKFIQILTKRVNHQQEQLLKLAYSSVRKRVAEVLLLMHEKYKVDDDDKQVGMVATREDLASIAGTATESFIRTLSDFKEENLVEVKEGKIFILDEKKLKELKN